MSNVSDVKIQPIKIMLNEEEHSLRYTLNAFAELEDAYGSIDAAMEKINSGSIKAIRKLIWVGLLHEDNDITELQVGNAIDVSNIKSFATSITDAIQKAMPAVPVEQKGIKPDPNAKAQK